MVIMKFIYITLVNLAFCATDDINNALEVETTLDSEKMFEEIDKDNKAVLVGRDRFVEHAPKSNINQILINMINNLNMS
jgi:hypothetical protein